MYSPLVSVIIPTYNRPDKVTRAVQSVLDQSYRDFEVIVVDDGSKDKPSFNFPVKYIRQEHVGAPAARNRGIKESRGKYIAFLDDDDTFLPDKLRKQVRFMEENPKVGLSYTSFYRNYEDGRMVIINPGAMSSRYPWLLFNCSVAMPTIMVRRECLNGFRFNENVSTTEDIILWSQIARTVKVGGIGEPLSIVNPGQYPRALQKEILLKSVDEILKYAVKGDPHLFPPIKLSLILFWNWNYWRIAKRNG